MANSSFTTERVRFPPQIKYIVGNEACERFSFYGMRSILVVFMTHYLLMADNNAKGVYHLFVGLNYLMTLLGAYLSDRFLGKYRTIIYLSIVYCLGHGALALWDTRYGIYFGLSLIALGAGGIKPCVSAHVGDQFSAKNSSLLPRVFDLFYWSINFGSFFSTLMIPVVLAKYGPRMAFAIPGVLMAIATVVFWWGRKQYIIVPPTGLNGPKGFVPVFWYCLTHRKEKNPSQGFFEVALKNFTADEVDAARAAGRVFKVFITVGMFWALWDQQGSSWVLQAEKMGRDFMGFHIEASQLQALNPILVLILIPLFTFVIYPLVGRLGVKLTPLRKMSTGMLLTGLSFASMGILQLVVDSGKPISVLWQIIPYLIMSASEVMVSITGLEFAYTQAPRSMKSTIMSFWLLTIALGNFLTAGVAEMNRFEGPGEFFFFGIVMFLVALVFIYGAVKYRGHDYIEPANVAAT